jgi:sulfatase maturation enzyme AslB (radical SAM superfamily)
MASGGVEAVGDGTVTAQISSASISDCQLLLVLNGSAGNSVQVKDGETITVEIQAVGDCACCETRRDCNGGSQSSGMWINKSGKENKTIVMNKSALENKIKFVIERVKKRSRGLRGNK